MTATPTDSPEMVERVAKALCKSKSFEGFMCCHNPAQMGRTQCPVKDGGYDDAARAAIEAMLPGWNFDISQAPRGKMVDTIVQTAKGARQQSRFVPQRVIVATKCDKVVLSQYIPDEERWMMLGKGEEPVAWFAWPEHPNSARGFSSAEQAGTSAILPSGVPAANSKVQP